MDYVFAGRVFAHQIEKSELIANAMKLGFRRVEIHSSDGLVASRTL
jgi:hypothetical protein